MASIRSLIAFMSSLIASIIAFISSLIPFFTSSSSSSFSSSPPPPPPPPSSSSSSSPPSSSSSSIPYDVFLSFRGEDTRYNFTDHLYGALVNRGIRTFRDDKLSRGEEIAPELFKVIERSRFSIVVFSENYADSKWCLNELVKIMECREKRGQIALSIFYHVDPSHVRKQTGSFGTAFNNYKKEKKETLQKWRTALTDAANLSGYHLSDGYESIHIKKIVEDIFSRLDRFFIHVDKNLVGLDSQVQELTLRLCMESTDVRMVGIYGCGGIGKTTLAKVVCNRIFHLYEGTIFLANVREVSASPAGLVKLQEQLLNTLMRENHNICNVDHGKMMIQNTLCFKRVLIIVDDIDNQRQLESLVGSKEWFGPGSRIIITTRNEQLLKVHRVDESYQMKELDVMDAIELFSWNAFRQSHPMQKYICLSNRIVYYANGLPLALEILGSSLYGKTIPEWESELDKLKSVPNMKILDVLRISYDGLDRLLKEIFLDIACFFRGENRYFVSRTLDGCKFYASSGIGHLCDRSLITILDNKINMHDLIQQMGWEIVREQFPGDPNKWSRLWEPEDIYRAFIRMQGMENVEAIFMDLSTLKEIQFKSKAWAEMKKLRLLQIIIRDYEEFMKKECEVHFPEDFEFPSYELSYLCWERCPLKSLPSNFDGGNLVEIKFSDSNIRQLWPGNKCLGKLKILNLSGSKQLKQISSFSRMPNLESLDLRLCKSLKKIDSSIGVLKKLTWLHFYWCKQLRSLPSSIQYLDSLKWLDLRGCSKLKKFPEIERGCMNGLLVLLLKNTAIKQLPYSIGHLTALEYLHVGKCKNLRSLPDNICRLKSLVFLKLRGCSNLKTFPEIMEDMQQVRHLDLSGTAIKELPSSVQRMNQLEYLYLSNCKHLVTLPNTVYNLEILKFLSVRGCQKLEKFCTNLGKLKCLYSIRRSSSIFGCGMEGSFFYDIRRQFYKWRGPNIIHWKLPEEIPELPSFLPKIIAHDCTDLGTFLNPSTVLPSSVLKLLKAANQGLMCGKSGSVIRINILGISGIPLWVSYQKMGNGIRIELPMNLFEDNCFLGFVFFFFFHKVENPKSLPYTWKLLGDSGGKKALGPTNVYQPWQCCGGASGQLRMDYYPKTAVLGNYLPNQFRHLEIFENSYDEKIQSCGVHLIYIQDPQAADPVHALNFEKNDVFKGI